MSRERGAFREMDAPPVRRRARDERRGEAAAPAQGETPRVRGQRRQQQQARPQRRDARGRRSGGGFDAVDAFGEPRAPTSTRRPHRRGQDDSFTCGHCKRFVGVVAYGGHNRNHCPYCLYSRHVDAKRPGDRASACRSLMAPVGAFQRRNGEHVVVHRCLGCGFERFNRIAADDDFDLVLALPALPPRTAQSPQDAADERADGAYTG